MPIIFINAGSSGISTRDHAARTGKKVQQRKEATNLLPHQVGVWTVSFALSSTFNYIDTVPGWQINCLPEKPTTAGNLREDF